MQRFISIQDVVSGAPTLSSEAENIGAKNHDGGEVWNVLMRQFLPLFPFGFLLELNLGRALMKIT